MTAIADRIEKSSGTFEASARLRKLGIGRGTAWLILIVILIVSLFPFWWALRTGLSSNSDLFAGEQSLLPVGYTNDNFERVLGTASEAEILDSLGRQNTGSFDFWQSLRVSVIVATAITVGQVLFSGMAAYAFARLQFWGRDKLFFLFLSGLMVPPIFTLIPNLIFIKNLGWLNSYPGIIAPFFFMTPFAVFFLRQFFLGISREVEEAALLDGAGHFRTFFGIIVPISAAPIATLAILTYITAWNEFLWPLVVARAPDRQPLTVALGQFTAQQPGTSPDWSGLMAGTLLAALPIIVIFLAFGRKVVDSIGFSGIK